MGLSALLIGAAMVGMEGVPLSGRVEDRDGKAVAGAEVWLADRPWWFGPKVLGHATTDADGRFRLDRPADATGGGPHMPLALWAFKPGFHVGLKAFSKDLPGRDQNVRMVLGPAARTAVTVERPDGKATAGAKVRVTLLHRGPSRMPAPLADRVVATVAGDGRATIEGFEPEEIGFVEVEADGLGVQRRSFFPPSPADKTVWLRPAGRVEGRIVADDPKALAGWTIEAYTRPDDEANDPREPSVGSVEVKTDEHGRFTIPAIATGVLNLSANPPEGVSSMALPVAAVVVRDGATVAVEVKAARAVRVEGVVRAKGAGTPIAGAQVNLFVVGRQGMPSYTTDAEGRFHALALPGKASVHVSNVPDGYVSSLGLSRNAVEIAEGVDRLALEPFEVEPGATVAGTVVDDRGEPVAGATVRGDWEYSDQRGGVVWSTTATSDANGRFVLRGIVDGVDVEVSARARDLATVGTVTAKAGSGRAVALKLGRADLFAVKGRVVGRGGEPVSGAVVQLEYKEQRKNMFSMGPVLFEDDTPIRTWEDGTFETPRELTRDREYSIKATAAGREPGQTTYLKPGPGAVVRMPDLVLRRAPKLRPVAGRVVDSNGKPVAGAVVFQTGDGPRRTQGTTDANGRFRVGGIDAGAAFLCVAEKGYHPLARLVRPNAGPVELTLIPIGTRPAKGLTTLPSRLSRREERAIAMDLLEPILPAALGADERGNMTRHLALYALALGDPGRFLAEVRDRPRPDAAPLYAAMALGLVDDDPAAALAVIEEDAGPHDAIRAAFEVVDALPPTEEKLRRAVLKAASGRLPAIRQAGQRLQPLAGIALRFLDLGDVAAARPLLEEAREVAATLPDNELLWSRGELAQALARVDLPAAEALLDGVPNGDVMIDLARVGVARRVAATDPAAAERLLGLVRVFPDHEKPYKLLEVAVPMAAKDLPRARRLAGRIMPAHLHARALGLMARSLAGTDPSRAKALLDEAFDRLAAPRDGDRVDAVRGTAALEMAALLPVAERIDPALVPDDLARALAGRPARPETLRFPDAQLLVNLAALLARYDREAAAVVFAPVADQLPEILAGSPFPYNAGQIEWVIQAAAVADPRRAAQLVNRLPGQGDRPEDPKFQVRLAAARFIALPLAVRRREAMGRIVWGWTKNLGD
ncbi:MAG TPA: carboxypeptidase-like regulatory domain-containing protein [Isosphaeraceae bacterium]|jgi:protocatechuate 3,4-dioxygenase beta subunit|nr:carboxypeptidase-like regulatory domain-containing protein [Isosphaeraceae bacterium]